LVPTGEFGAPKSISALVRGLQYEEDMPPFLRIRARSSRHPLQVSL